jgi:uncharacterized protein YjiS (DUF1127 family)
MGIMTQHILIAHSFSTRIIESLIDSLRTFVQYRKDKRITKQTIKELSRLSDYDLEDIGLTRGDIYYVANSRSSIKNREWL